MKNRSRPTLNPLTGKAIEQQIMMTKPVATPKDQLWDAAEQGDLSKFKKLYNALIIQNANEYHEERGITLLHAVVSGDVYYHDGQFAEIAAILLKKGANLELPAVLTKDGKKPANIAVGESPFDAARKYSYASEGHSYIYDGFRVMPVFQKHLGLTPRKKSPCDTAFQWTRVMFWEMCGNKQKVEAAFDELRVPSYK
jgi:hypothetical protein